LIEIAVNSGLLNRLAMYGKSNFINARAMKEGFASLNIVLPEEETRRARELAVQRNLILHTGGRYPMNEKAKAAFEPIMFLQLTDTEVKEAIRLAGRCAEARIRQFLSQHCR
jgi:hypothetical protein